MVSLFRLQIKAGPRENKIGFESVNHNDIVDYLKIRSYVDEHPMHTH